MASPVDWRDQFLYFLLPDRLYRGDLERGRARAPVELPRTVLDDGGRSAVRIDLPAAGMLILG